MRALSIFFGAALTALMFAGAATSKSPGPQPTPNSNGGYLVSPWPPAASELAKNVAKASFARTYSVLWSYLHPSYQKGISELRWQNCKRAHPTAPPSVTIRKISIASSAAVPIRLPLLGQQTVQEVQLQIQFTTGTASGTQYALEYAFLIKQKGKWLAVWPAAEYSAYKDGKCYVTPQGPDLF